MRAILNWTIGLIAAAGLTGGAVSMAASAMPASEASGSTSALQAQLDQLNRQKAALDAQVTAQDPGSPSSTVPASSGSPSTPTTTGRSAPRSAFSISTRDATVPSTAPTTLPITPSTTPPTPPPTPPPTTTPTTTPSWSEDNEGGHDD